MSVWRRLWWLLCPAPPVCPKCDDPAWTFFIGAIKGAMCYHMECSGCGHCWQKWEP